MAFLGSCSYSIDTKKRVLIPGKYREELGNTFYVTRSLEGCLTIYTEADVGSNDLGGTLWIF